jgi:hypothetical protein
MASIAAHSGQFKYQRERFEFRVSTLEFVRGKHLMIEAICYAPDMAYPNNKEHVFKYSTTDFHVPDEPLKVALTIISAIIKKAKLPKNKLYKLTVRNNEVYWIVGA